ncbi:LETM1-like protein [Artemisia annua]|uniref:LETM1-like protein n=1 Tax=Artemisia annua TaxID=35608 RepID=A0A2U1NQS8_ARTAN|nr:LETM1-like protein [Artemisia annua]
MGKLEEIVRNVRIVVNRMKEKPARSESRHVEDDWRKSVEHRLSAQEGSIQHLTYNVASLVNLFHNFLGRSSLPDQVVGITSLPPSEEDDPMLQKLDKHIDKWPREVTSEELASATASTTGVHLEKTPTGPTPSSSSVGSSMVLTLENKPSDQPTVSSSILSSVSNSDMSLVGDSQNKYNYGDLSPEEEWRSGELKKTAEDLDDILGKARLLIVRTCGSVANDKILGFAKLLNDELTHDNISRIESMGPMGYDTPTVGTRISCLG